MAIPFNIGESRDQDLKTLDTWILGSHYSASRRADIRRHSQSILRMTYRSQFPPLAPYHYTSDDGWGCMLRSAQMLMAQALQQHMLGRDWRIADDLNLRRKNKAYCDIMKWFLDYPGPPFMYSLHHFVQCGMSYDKLPGEWYGPNTAALVLRDLAKLHHRKYKGPIEVLVSPGDTIYISEVEKLCTESFQLLNRDSPLTPAVASPGISPSNHLYEKSKSEEEINSKLKLNPPYVANDNVQGLAQSRSADSIADMSKSAKIDLNASKVKNYNIAAVTTSNNNSNNNNNNNNQISDNYDNSKIDISVTPSPSGPIKSFSNSETVFDASAIIVSNKMGDLNAENDAKFSIKSDASFRVHDPFYDPLLNPPPESDKSQEKEWRCSLMLIVPLRLGIHSVNEEYFPEIKELFQNRHCIGMLGGRARHALYFVGYRGETILGLDPHSVYCNPTVTSPFPSEDYMSQVHSSILSALDLSMLDPSVALAFYFRDRKEFQTFCEESKVNCDKKIKDKKKPLYFIEQSRPSYESLGGDWGANNGSGDGYEDSENEDDEDYVFV